jgi:S-adenosyl-L-methionine hydrolase (adenosine-forming)
MPNPIITLTTDFGEESPYVAAMKGVTLGVNPAGRLLDLTHQVPPQDVRYAAFFLAGAVPYFPAGTIHVAVVDPGVGSERAVLYVEAGEQRLLVPDNGCWTSLLKPGSPAPRVIRLAEPRYWRQPVSATFHGRDIFAPVAGHVSLGLDPAELGPAVTEWVQLPEPPPPRPGMNSLSGEVVFVDHFGNLITNIPADKLQPPDVLSVGKRTFRTAFRWVRTYAEANPGRLVALASSNGMLEVAVVQGNAARKLKAGVGTPVTVGWAR